MNADTADDVFEGVLNLEEQFYRQGFELGVADGSKSGRIEGRVFGLEKGFEKFLDMGKLSGKAAVWNARLGHRSTVARNSDLNSDHVQLPPLTRTDRLGRHVERLVALSDTGALSTENNEDAVSQFDDQLKDAKAKATLISRLVGEDQSDVSQEITTQSSGDRTRRVRMRRNEKDTAGPRSTGEMEDFVGLPESRG